MASFGSIASFAAIAARIKSDQLIGVGQLSKATLVMHKLVHPNITELKVGLVFHKFARHNCNIMCAAVLSGLGKPSAVGKIGVLHLQLLCPAIHLFNEQILASTDCFGNSYR